MPARGYTTGPSKKRLKQVERKNEAAARKDFKPLAPPISNKLQPTREEKRAVEQKRRRDEPQRKKANYFESKRYLQGGKSKPSSLLTLHERRKKIFEETGRFDIGQRIGRYDPKKHGVSDPVARDVRRLLSKHRSPAEKTQALTRLQALGMVPGGKQPKADRPQGPIYMKAKDGKVEQVKRDGTGRIKTGKFKDGKFVEDHSFGDAIDAQIDKYVDSTKKEFKAVGKAVGWLTKDKRSSQQKSLARAGIGAVPADFHIVQAATKTAKKGLAAGGGVIFEGLDRLPGAVESAVAKAAADAGAFSAKKRARIKKARTPLEVLAHGRNWKKDVTGGDLTEALGIGRHLGIGADVVADPTTYLSLGLAPAAKAAARGAASKAAIEHALADASTIKLKTKAGLRYKEALEQIRVPASNKAVELALHAAKDRRVKAQPRLSIATPAGRRTKYGVNLPVPSRIPVKKMNAETRNKLYDVAGRKEVALDQEKRRLVIEELEGRIGAAQRKRNVPLADQLRAQLSEYKRGSAAPSRDEIREIGRSVVGKRHAVRLDEVAAQRNDRAMVHAYRVAADEYARTTQALFSKAHERASTILDGSQAEVSRKVKRVQTYLIAKTENLGGHGVIERAIKLAPDEQKYADNLMEIHRAQLDHGRKTGVLARGQDDYVGMRIWEKLDSPKDIGENVSNAIKNRSTTTGFQRHRSVASVTDRASEVELADSIFKLADQPVTREQARDIAQDLFVRGKHRAISELVARRIERGEPVRWDDLTTTEKASVDWASRQGFISSKGGDPIPMFKTPHTDPETTEGHVLLANPEHYRQTNDLARMSTSEATLPTLLSVKKDLQQVREMRAGLAPDQTELAADLDQMEARLLHHADQADPATMLNKQIEEIRQLVDEHPDVIPDEAPAEWKTTVIDGGREWTKTAPSGHRYDIVRTSVGKYRVDVLNPGEQYSLLTRVLDATESGGQRFRSLQAAQKAAEEDAARFVTQTPEVAAQTGTRIPIVPEKGAWTEVLDKDGGLWLRGPDSHDKPPIEGMPKRPAYEAGPLDDPFDFTSRLPDTREEGKMVVLDPRVTGYLRSKAQGATSGFNARWQGMDQVLGRSASEFDERLALDGAGESVLQRDLRVDRDENGQITGYVERGEDGRRWAPDELTFPEPTLIPNQDRSFWIDPRDGQEYVRPVDTMPSALMIQEIAPDRLWPTQAVDAMQHDMINAGELDSSAGLDTDFLDATFDVGVHHGFQKVMSMVRFGVTTPFPAYHVRNLISDLIKSLQADTGVLFHPIANAKLTAAAFHKGKQWNLNVPGMGKMKVEDFLFVADMFGVRSGHHIAEVMNLLKTGKFTESQLRHHVNNSWFVPGGKSTRFGANREDMARYMTFLQAMRSNGGDAAAAAFHMTRHHFNYNDLNRLERRTMRNIFLFYTWYRKNIPLQLMELARRPGFFAGVAHTYNSLEEGQTPFNIGPFAGAAPNWPGRPDYLRDKLQAATVSWKGYSLNVGFGAPWGDLQWLSLEGIEDAPTMLSPLATIPLQQIFRTDPMTHRRYKSYEPGGVVEALAPIYKMVTGDELPVDEKGQPVMNWRVATLLRNLPLIGRGTFSIGDVPSTRDPGRLQSYGKWLNPITGLNINVAPRPGSTREEAAAKKDVEGRLVQGVRRQGLEDLSNLPKTSNAYTDALEKIQRQLDADAKQHGTSQYLNTTPQSGHYIKRSRRRGSTFGSSPLSGTGGRSVLK
jgi:hypothetical protein